MKTIKKIMISCDEATTISDKKQYVEATLLERMKMSMHILFCKNCRVYDEQNTVLTKAIDQRFSSENGNENKLSKKEKVILQKEIDTNL